MDNDEHAPVVPLRGRPANSSRVQTCVYLNPRCEFVSTTRPGIPTGVLVAAITWKADVVDHCGLLSVGVRDSV